MRIRRCGVVWLEPREQATFDLEDLLSGGTGVTSSIQWHAHAPHLDAPVAVDAQDVRLLGELSPVDWVDVAPLRSRYGQARIRQLLRAGLVIGRGKAWAGLRELDERFRAGHWHGLSAVAHMQSRWHGTDAVAELEEEGLDSAEGLREQMGPPPPLYTDRGDRLGEIPLARASSTAFDELLDRRTVCRNFDTDRELPRAQFECVLERVFAARARMLAVDDFEVMKRTSPSGGGLHPTEAWLLVQRVAGIAPGLYHYRPVDHALRPIPAECQGADLHAEACLWLAGQDYLADAHVLVVLAPRFERTFWKYRNHSKAYRVCILDVGHLSQTLLLSATEQGLGSFVTAAINEGDIERSLGLTGFAESPLAVCGFGIRADKMTTFELDPNHKVWPR